MRRITLTLIAVMFMGRLSFAQDSSAVRTYTGKVESISVANPKEATPSVITVVDDKGQRMNFVVEPKTIIYDKDDKAPALGKIEKEDRVIIEYRTSKEGFNIAELIKSVE